MGKALLLSVLVATVAIPALGASDPKPRRGLRWVLAVLLVFHVVYVGAVAFIHAPNNIPEWFR